MKPEDLKTMLESGEIGLFYYMEELSKLEQIANEPKKVWLYVWTKHFDKFGDHDKAVNAANNVTGRMSDIFNLNKPKGEKHKVPILFYKGIDGIHATEAHASSSANYIARKEVEFIEGEGK